MVKYQEVCEARASNWQKRIGAMGSWSYSCKRCFCRPSARNGIITRNRRTDVLIMDVVVSSLGTGKAATADSGTTCVIRDTEFS